jgi:Flp pilus assembly protein TadG
MEMKVMTSGIKWQRGTSIIEFAFVAPLFFLLLFGIIEFSVILFDKATITNASREAARAGIVFRDGDRSLANAITNENPDIIQVASDYATDYLISLGGASAITTTVSRNDVNGNGIFDVGDELTVDISYPYSYLVLPSFVDALAGLNLGATTVMLAE